jgi:hypothetical protein
LKRLANHASFNEKLNLLSRSQWDGMRTGYGYDLFDRIQRVLKQREGTFALTLSDFHTSPCRRLRFPTAAGVGAGISLNDA